MKRRLFKTASAIILAATMFSSLLFGAGAVSSGAEEILLTDGETIESDFLTGDEDAFPEEPVFEETDEFAEASEEPAFEDPAEPEETVEEQVLEDPAEFEETVEEQVLEDPAEFEEITETPVFEEPELTEIAEDIRSGEPY